MKTLFLILLGYVSLFANSFDSQLKSYLQNKFAAYEKFEYQVIQSPKDFFKIEINTEKNFRLVKNYAYVPIKIYDKQNSSSLSVLTVRVKLYKTILVSVKNISQNEPLDLSLFETKLDDVSLYEDRTVNSHEIKNKRSKVLVKSGTVLTKELMEEIPLINKGDKVVIHAGKDGVDISVDAISRQDGCAGDVISVQSNNKIFKAKVIDKFNLTLVE